MHHELEQVADATAVADRGAAIIAAAARDAVATSGSFTIAVSGGRTPQAMFERLATLDVPWEQVSIFQVDERVAPDGDPSRNLTNLEASLSGLPFHLVAMGVTFADLEAAATTYGEALPARFDLVHLGIGPDGHTASLVPGDPVLDVTDRLVGVTEPYMGYRRMTLTYPALARADHVLWEVVGADKRDALHKLLDGDTSIPAGRVRAQRSTVLADDAAL